jgi:hypothetical protein
MVCETLSQKYLTQKRTDRVAQVVEHLPSKPDALNSDPNTTKKKKKKKDMNVKRALSGGKPEGEGKRKQ